MIDEVIEYFRSKGTFIEFKNIELDFMRSVFGSPQQIFGIAMFKDESSLKRDWEKASHEFAVRIQSQLSSSLYNLKWDMYLILVTQSDVKDIELYKNIENDRMYFKKIVIPNDLKEFKRKLPIELNIENSDQLEVFSDKQFIDELKDLISVEVTNRLNLNIYEQYSINIANNKIFLEPYNRGVDG